MEILMRLIKPEARAFFCLAACLLCNPVVAGEQPLELYEQKIKAGLVYNFLKYTVWPESDSLKDEGRLRICLLGNPFDGYLSPLDGRTAQQYIIVISQIQQITEVGGCNIVVIDTHHESNLPALLKSLKDKHILTVSDIRDFAKRGGMVELAKEGEKINLYINKKAVAHAGLDIEDRMLRLARFVSG